MRRAVLLAGAALVATSTLALAAPESLLPPSFQTAPPAPSPSPTPRATSAPTPGQPAPDSTSSPVVQPVPSESTGSGAAPAAPVTLPEDFPSIAELERMEPEEIDELFGLKPKFDIPPAARRAVERVGVIGPREGGFPVGSLDDQPASLVRAAIEGTRGPLVSRWGHILVRRALASRLDAPADMDPVEFAAMRAALLNRMGEGAAARALVQDIDSANYTTQLANAAFDAYLATGDLLGMCPVARLKGDLRSDPEWELTRSICDAFAGEARGSERELNRALSRGIAPRIDVLLAQRYAGAAGEGRRAVNIEWNDVEELTPWRAALARALGVEIPEGLREGAGRTYDFADVMTPAVPLLERIAAADEAARAGLISSAAMVDLYSQLWADPEIEEKDAARTLREAYVARDPASRLAAIETLWEGGEADYGRQVLTAYAAARLMPAEELEGDAAPLIASMLTAGLDRNAMRWRSVVPSGSLGWALLALAEPEGGGADRGALDTFIDEYGSSEERKSRFLLAGLAGLGRIDDDAVGDFSGRLGVNLERETRWSRMISLAAQYDNAALVSLLAGLGMQGEGWDKMTALHLYHIVRALDQVGLDAQARMIAAEAVARG